LAPALTLQSGGLHPLPPIGPNTAAFFEAHTMDRPFKILAVDNEPSVTTALRFVFNGPRYEITCVGSGLEALHHLDANSDRFDVIIVDQKMPRLTGVELVQEIRNRNVGGKIIVVSANLSAEVCEAYQRMDVSLIFSKPFDVNQLRNAVDQLAA
jgi:two-component system, response regulator, stage 0 sporulation protein F